MKQNFCHIFLFTQIWKLSCKVGYFEDFLGPDLWGKKKETMKETQMAEATLEFTKLV